MQKTTLLFTSLLFLTFSSFAQSTDTTKTSIQEVNILEKADPFQALTNKIDLSVKETLKYPGVFFDPARLAMSYAGVVNDSDLGNGLSIRGASPDLMQWRLEGAEILNPNHLANAASLSDRAEVNSGGVNMLSTQMLGTSSLVTGAYSAEYNNLVSGCMDMRLRTGATDRQHFTGQIGLVGIDLAAEGPLTKNKNLTYLANYRYSTVGLLSKLGVSFGGESIAFQDFGVHLNYVTNKNFSARVYYIGGNSQNIYTADRAKDTLENQRDLQDISFKQQNRILGMTAVQDFKEFGSLRLSVAHSEVLPNTIKTTFKETGRKLDPTSILDSDKLFSVKKLLSAVLSYRYNYKDKYLVQVGAGTKIFSDTSGSYQKLALIPSSRILDTALIYYTYLDNTFNFSPWASLQIGYQYSVLKQSARWQNIFQGQIGTSNKSDTYTVPFSPNIAFRLGKTNNLNFILGYNSNQRDWRYGTYTSPSKQFFVSANYPLPQNAGQLRAEAFYQKDKYPQVRRKGVSLSYLYQNKTLLVNANCLFYRSLELAVNDTYKSTHYDGRFASNLTLGKEWQGKRASYGINTHLFYRGGMVELEKQLGNYFRSDLRLYRTVQKKHHEATLSLDIQNVTNQQNEAFHYYDAYLKKSVLKYQTGLVPVLNYRISW
jgi:hypothetical protein